MKNGLSITCQEAVVRIFGNLKNYGDRLRLELFLKNNKNWKVSYCDLKQWHKGLTK